ncbi:MAG: TolB family protein, partial [Polyangiaceae bacterium]
PVLGSSGTFTIAPVAADGSLVYWATTSSFDQGTMNTQLEGFHVGEESVVSALQTAQVQMKVRATWGASGSGLKDQTTQVQCIGCHTSTPDGLNAAFTAQWPWPNAMASVESKTVGQVPSYLTAAAQSNLSPNVNGAYSTGDVQKYMLGIQTFSKAHFTSGDRVVVTTQGSSWYRSGPNDTGSSTGVVAKLMWFDLETSSMDAGTGFGEILRTGDSNSAAAPSWSHDGEHIVYASTDTGAEDGRMGTGASDLVVVPYNGRMGGAVTKVPGASDPAYDEYYPAYSADDSLIAFDRIPTGMSMYIQPAAEVFVIRSAGGTATRVKANDPVSCSGSASPGVQNTWPKWSPTSTLYDGKTYHWLIFSSKRSGSTAQLYAT